MENTIIRNVKKEDLKDISHIVVEGWKSAYRGIIDDNFLDNMSVEDIYNRRLQDYQENEFIVAERNNEIVGFCRYTINNIFSKEYEDIDSELIAIYVKVDKKRQGIGEKLFKYVIQSQKQNNNKNMVLWCLEKNYDSRKFYEKMGGTLYGENYIEKGGKKYKEVGFKYDLNKRER